MGVKAGIEVNVKLSPESEAILDSFKYTRRKVQQNLDTEIRRLGVVVRRQMVKYIIEGPKTGIHHPGLPNRSSAEGQSPAYQTGKLVESITAITRPTEVEVGSDLEYAKILEDNRKRPYFSRAARELQTRIARDYEFAIRNAIRGE